MSKQVYFVVVVEEDGSARIDDERAAAVFDGEDVWVEDDPNGEPDHWVVCYDEASAYETAQEKLQNLLMPSWFKESDYE